MTVSLQQSWTALGLLSLPAASVAPLTTPCYTHACTCTHTYTHTYSYTAKAGSAYGFGGALHSWLPSKSLNTPDIASVSFTHCLLHSSLQFHRKCELSTLCDGGELRDHILLPTSICPVSRVSAAVPPGLQAPWVHSSDAGSIQTVISLRGLPHNS